MPEFLVFAGTSEGRRLVELLAARGARVCASVATNYGRALLPAGVRVYQERLDEAGVAALLAENAFDCVIDATHPYAAQATRNIQAGCRQAGVPYLRLLRPAQQAAGLLYAKDAAQAAQLLAGMQGRVLLTTGSKELEAFAGLRERAFVRVLPVLESVQRCLSLGFLPKQIIAMQGPFSRELNAAMMRQTGACILVTKESGAAGGFLEKVEAAQEVGASVVVIGHPQEAEGLPFEALVQALEQKFGLMPEKEKGALRFPLFADLSGCRVLLVGGGAVAARRARVLLPFCKGLRVVAPDVCPALEALGIPVERREYRPGDCMGYQLVLAATGTRAVNRAVYEEAVRLGIPVNVSDRPQECSFYFPAIARRGRLVFGVGSDGVEHGLVRQAAQRLRERLDEIVPGERDG